MTTSNLLTTRTSNSTSSFLHMIRRGKLRVHVPGIILPRRGLSTRILQMSTRFHMSFTPPPPSHLWKEKIGDQGASEMQEKRRRDEARREMFRHFKGLFLQEKWRTGISSSSSSGGSGPFGGSSLERGTSLLLFCWLPGFLLAGGVGWHYCSYGDLPFRGKFMQEKKKSEDARSAGNLDKNFSKTLTEVIDVSNDEKSCNAEEHATRLSCCEHAEIPMIIDGASSTAATMTKEPMKVD
ncbi:unnamed protein product [Amoebophrya sp. A25]|nr:unnamed protein product [Amoebophrya sp. A25]|eukprot:GSA25T00016306001.1